jgi:hypothetical protein
VGCGATVGSRVEVTVTCGGAAEPPEGDRQAARVNAMTKKIEMGFFMAISL